MVRKMNEHENWMRYYSFKLAKKVNSSQSVDDLIADAEKISDFILSNKKAELLVIGSKSGSKTTRC